MLDDRRTELERMIDQDRAETYAAVIAHAPPGTSQKAVATLCETALDSFTTVGFCCVYGDHLFDQTGDHVLIRDALRFVVSLLGNPPPSPGPNLVALTRQAMASGVDWPRDGF